MKQRTRIYYSEVQKSAMWDRWQKGESLNEIARLFDRNHSSISRILYETGGVRPSRRTRSSIALSLSEREEISRGIASDESMRSIATRLGRAPSTISREIQRNGGDGKYRAARADKKAWERASRPKSCKLAGSPWLRRAIENKLRVNWSPEQIAGWLKRTYPGDESKHVSHETIYRSLFIQARGVLKKELLQYLRSERTMRKSIHAGTHGDNRGQIPNTVSISKRPASVEDRAVPGHWEGDLISGTNNSYVATLVERHSRYVMLAKVENKDTESVVSALIKQANYPLRSISH